MIISDIEKLDIDNVQFKINKSSITIKENGKTKSVITNIENFAEMPFNKKVDWNIKFKRKGIKNIPFSRNLIIEGDVIYYIVDVNQYSALEKQIENAWEEGYKAELVNKKQKN